jgi:hypothetical protein
MRANVLAFNQENRQFLPCHGQINCMLRPAGQLEDCYNGARPHPKRPRGHDQRVNRRLQLFF